MKKFIATIFILPALIIYYGSSGSTTQLLSKSYIMDTTINTTTINCDSVYPRKNYQITLTTLNSTNENEPNMLFTLSRLFNGTYLPVLSDAVFSTAREIEFADFNNDNVPDILVQNISDARSNWTYYLYLVDTVENKLKKIKGFEAIKNPTYLPKHNLVANYVMSGHIWTSFYKIKDDTVKDLGIVIYDNQTNDGHYERNYRKAILSIVKSKE